MKRKTFGYFLQNYGKQTEAYRKQADAAYTKKLLALQQSIPLPPRTVPDSKLRPKRAQSEEPLELEKPEIEGKEPELFERRT